MFDFFKTMENFENSVIAQECISPETPKYLDLRRDALSDFEQKFNELVSNYDEVANTDTTERLKIDNDVSELFNRISNNNKKSEEELTKLEKEVERLDKELEQNVEKIEEQKKIIARNKSISDVQAQKLEDSVEKGRDVQQWYNILIGLIVIFIAIQCFVLFKL